MASTPTTNPDLTPSNFQTQSPLFGDLPGEIRNEIFNLALIQYEDEGEAYPEDSYWYRPGFRGPRKSSSALLRTCKLAYAEGKKVFLRELEWAFWFREWGFYFFCDFSTYMFYEGVGGVWLRGDYKSLAAFPISLIHATPLHPQVHIYIQPTNPPP